MKAIIEPHPWLPYVAPFALFVGLTGMQPYVPGGVAWIYPAKTVLTGLLILAVRRWLVPSGDWAAVTILIGAIVVRGEHRQAPLAFLFGTDKADNAGDREGKAPLIEMLTPACESSWAQTAFTCTKYLRPSALRVLSSYRPRSV